MTTTIFAGDHYLVADDGTHAYPLNAADKDRVMVLDNARLVPAPRKSYGDPEVVWLLTPGSIPHVTVTSPATRNRIGYRLIDPEASSAKFPQTLTAAEYAARFGDDDETEDGFMASRIYRAIYDDIPGTATNHATAGLSELAGSVDAHQDRSWAADQPGSLVYSANYHHLLPGRMGGVRAAVLAALEAEYGSRSVVGGRDSGVYDWGGRTPGLQIEVTFHLDYSPPRWTTRQKTTRTGRRSKATEKVKAKRTVQVDVPLTEGTYVAGASKADAAAAFDRVVAEWVAWVGSHQLVVCGHCDGEGSVLAQGDRP